MIYIAVVALIVGLAVGTTLVIDIYQECKSKKVKNG